jgi:hypothetical protein
MNKLSFILIFLFLFTSAVSYSQDYKIYSDSISFENKKHDYSVKIIYPQISGFANKETENDFNEYVKEFAEAHADTFKMEMKEWKSPNPDFSSEYEMLYNIFYNSNELISVKLNVFSYYAGAAHPNTYFYSINYDLKKNKVLKLSNLFNGSYLKVISDICIADIKKQSMEISPEVDMTWINEGAGPKKENFAVFNNTDSTFVVTFPAYQVGSYAEGPKEVEIPFSKLKDIIDMNGPYGRFVSK